VFLNTEKKDLHTYASLEGARRTPPKGDEWLLRIGTLGAAMRLKALSQAPKDIQASQNLHATKKETKTIKFQPEPQ
jgi:hypothetical protein